jgi:class I fructose-bisphosphate aldolase
MVLGVSSRTIGERRHALSDLGKQIRLSRIFGHPSRRLFAVAVDHFVGYPRTMEEGLSSLPAALSAIMPAHPDSVTMYMGAAMHCWAPYSGTSALIVQVGAFTPDDRVREVLGEPEDAIRLGADAIAISIAVRGPSEGAYLRMLTDTVRRAERYQLPVFAHIYPRQYGETVRIVSDPDNIAWAVRCGIECGADVVKVAYPGDAAAFRDIVAACPAPIVAAGGERAASLDIALETSRLAIDAGARGVTIGRNVWGAQDPLAAARAFGAVVHKDRLPAESLG